MLGDVDLSLPGYVALFTDRCACLKLRDIWLSYAKIQYVALDLQGHVDLFAGKCAFPMLHDGRELWLSKYFNASGAKPRRHLHP